MNYDDFDKHSKYHINGVLGAYLDQYIRSHRVWSSEQMYEDFLEEIKGNHAIGFYGKDVKEDDEGNKIPIYKEAQLWLVSEYAKSFLMERFNKKLLKHEKLAKMKSPLIDRAQLGFRVTDREIDKLYDINFGLKYGYCYQKAEEVEKIDLIPWSIAHVEDELLTKYNKNLIDVLEELCESYIEIKFYKEWIKRYYDNKNNPAIIPQLCGTRTRFVCYRDEDGEYTLEFDPSYEPTNVRFDFAIVNFNKQTMVVVELDGGDHKTKKQRINDSIKRTLVSNEGWQVIPITGYQVVGNVNNIFNDIKEFLE